jgi:hypothetical protein
MLTKEAQNRLENAKTDLKPFLTILGTNQRAADLGYSPHPDTLN